MTSGADLTLFGRFRDGDLGALYTLALDSWTTKIWAWTLRSLRKNLVAEPMDVLCETLADVEVVDRLRESKNLRELRRSLFREISRVANNFGRRKRPISTATAGVDVADMRTRTASSYARAREDVHLLVRALSALPQNIRDLVAEHYLLGETVDELAEKYRMPRSTLADQIAAGLRDLKRNLKGLWKDLR